MWWAGSFGQPRLGAVAAAVRARRRGQRGAVGRRRADRRGGPRALPRAGGRRSGARERGSGGARAARLLARRRRPRPRRCRRRRSTARSTGGGGARRSATSPPAPTSRTWRASRRSRSSTTSPAPHAPPVDDDGRDALRAVPSLLAEMSVGTEVGTLVHRVFEAVDFAAADLDVELLAEIAAAQARRRVELGDVDAVVAGLARRDRDAAGADRRRCRPAGRRARRPTRRARLRASAGRRRRPERSGTDARGDRRRAARHSAPATRWPATPSASSTRGCAASVRGYLTGQHRPRRAARRRALRGRRLQDELARATRRGADRLAPPAGRAERRDDPLPLRTPGAALHGRAAPLSALATAGLLRRAQPRRRPVPVRARDDRAGHARRRRHRRAACSPGSRRPRSSRR